VGAARRRSPSALLEAANFIGVLTSPILTEVRGKGCSQQSGSSWGLAIASKSERSTETHFLHGPLVLLPRHHPSLEVGNLFVAHPLEGICGQSRPAARGAIDDDSTLGI
jgi:hypothetical protein